ncbi:MAG: GxxExxY protein [Anaerolineae bacterium]|nr:GxxExxY protein [Anaerolineae bacterium]
MPTIIHKDLSYAVKGVCFDVHNALGPSLAERFYQAALAIGLEAKGIRCETEKSFEVYYRGTRVGLYFVDMWIEDGKLLLELKVAPEITAMHRAQTLSYLKVTGADLGIIVNYGENSLTDERLPNYLRDKKVAFEWQPSETGEDWLYPQLTQRLFEALHRVHFELGPGFLHQVYRRATMVELQHQEIAYRYIKNLPVSYQGHLLGEHPARLINVEEKILLAVFAVQELDGGMQERLRARLRLLGLKLGFLANFNGVTLKIIPVRAN